MGTINHNAIIATTWNEKLADSFQSWVDELSEHEKKLIVRADSWCNWYHSFLIAPDGSKEGWRESDEGDVLRNRVIERLSIDNYDGSSPWAWVEVGFGEYGQKVIQGNCKNRYSDGDYAE